METREQKAKKTKEKLIQAARELIMEKEFSRITVDEITRKAGVAKGTFYVYFSTKEEILNQSSYNGFEPLLEGIRSMDLTPQEKIVLFLKESIHKIQQGGLSNCQTWFSSVVQGQNGIGQFKLEFDLKAIEEFLLEIPSMNQKKAVSLSRQITALYYGALNEWNITDGQIDPLEVVEQFCTDFLKSI